MLKLSKLKDLQENISSGWFFILISVLSVVFVVYGSIYQSPYQLNNLVSIIILVVLFGLSFRYRNNWGNWAGAVLIFLLFLPPLYWLWRSGQYDTSAIAGIFPIGDPLQYYGDALRLHYGLPLSAFSSRRPLFMGFLSVIMKFTNDNLQATLLVLAVMVTLSVVFLSIELKKSFGPITAMMVVVILYYCYKGHGFIGKTLTEQLGLLLGSLALTLCLQGLRLKKDVFLWLGLLTLTLALNVRAGAFFILPAIIVWKSFHGQNKRFSIAQFGFFSGAVLLGFLLNFLALKIIGSNKGIPFENFGSTFYGLVAGYKGWFSLYIEHPGVRDASAWPYIIAILRQHPENLFLGIIRAYADFFTPKTMFRFLYFSPTPQLIAAYFLYICSFAGLLRLIRMQKAASLLCYFVSLVFYYRFLLLRPSMRGFEQ